MCDCALLDTLRSSPKLALLSDSFSDAHSDCCASRPGWFDSVVKLLSIDQAS